MPRFDIYFVGLICFLCENENYTRAEVLWDEDLEHVPFMYLGPTARNTSDAILLNGDVEFTLPPGGAPCDDDPNSPAVHLKPCIGGSPRLRMNPPIASTITLPAGHFGIASIFEDAKISNPYFTRVQPVSQLVVLECDTNQSYVTVLMGGSVIDMVDSSSYVVIGNVSQQHNPEDRNHFQKYLKLTEGGSDIATVVSASQDPRVVAGPFPGRHSEEALTFLASKLAKGEHTYGAPDCTITQWP